MDVKNLSPAALAAAEKAAGRITRREQEQALRKKEREASLARRKKEEAAIERRCRPKDFDDAQWLTVWDRASDANNGGYQGLEDEIDDILEFLDDMGMHAS